MIELLMAVFLFSVVLLGVYAVLYTGQVIYNRDTALLEMEAQCRNAVDRVVREVREASSQTITANYNNTTNDKILFTIPSAVGIQYYLSGTDLVMEYPAGTTKKFASHINLLKFSLVGSLLSIHITASQTVYNQVISFSIIEKVRLRNE
jgi:type II secretory pathway pseudopilin PulG